MYTNGMKDLGNPGAYGVRPNRAQRRADRTRNRSTAKAAPASQGLGTVQKEVLLLLAAITSILLLVAPAMAQEGEAKVRMVHLSPDAPEVMVTLDGQPVDALANVAYMDATPYLPIPAGPHEVAVYATADATKPVLEVEISPEAGSSYTIAGVGLLSDGTFGAKLFEDDNSAPTEGKFKARVVHAIPDVGPATVSVAGGPDLFDLPGFANASEYEEADPGTYTFDVTPAGADAPAFSVNDVPAQAGKTYTAFAIGEAADGSVGAIITDDSDDGEVVAVQGGVVPLPVTGGSSKSYRQEIQNPVPAPEVLAAEAERAAAAEEKVRAEDKKEAESAESETPAKTQEAQAAPVEVAQTTPVASTPVAAAPVAAAPVQSVPVQTPAPSVPVVDPGYAPPVVDDVDVYVPEVPVDGAAIAASVNQSVNSAVASAVAGVPVTSLPDANYIVDQTLSQVPSVPVDSGYVPPSPVVPAVPNVPSPDVPINAVVNQSVAVINSGARKRFVTIRKMAPESTEYR